MRGRGGREDARMRTLLKKLSKTLIMGKEFLFIIIGVIKNNFPISEVCGAF
jgi:hypothetical protein